MRIVFVEPGASPVPVGGTRIIYEYANGLAARGHDVTLVHPVKLEQPASVAKMARLAMRHAVWGLTGRWRPRWMEVHPGVRSLWTNDLEPARFPEADIVVATTWNTVAPVLALPERCGAKVYFAQSWDFGSAPEEPLLAAWRAPVARIVNNRAMQEAAAAMGLKATYVPNGVSGRGFGIDTPLAERDPGRVAMLYHPAPYKGAADGLAALAAAREEHPSLKAELFGARPRPAEAPDWITYHQLPRPEALRAMLNRASIFISASSSESWGLAPCEAGLCGAALAVTDNFGHREYARQEETALVSPPGDSEALAANILRLARDPELRARLNEALREQLAQFSWSRSVEAMEQVLSRLTAPA